MKINKIVDFQFRVSDEVIRKDSEPNPVDFESLSTFQTASILRSLLTKQNHCLPINNALTNEMSVVKGRSCDELYVSFSSFNYE